MVIIGATFREQNKKLLVLGKTPTADSTIVRKHGRLPNFSCGTGIYRAGARQVCHRWRAVRHASGPKNLFFSGIVPPYTSFHQRYDVPYMEHIKRPSGWGIA
ncbi:hypothetical protein SB379_01940 [Burkholderia multivorans]|uniref:hypothetical protein n=1 Tax=Burkholderia multivorans TaxID=87883 RepID=UPI0011B27490|nr:hypothetical protein [Burkholderia multivorans]MBR8019586.1 hypothetical protein [Burkholderia multivorans]MEB2508324.1 hypothetical protein [Burkholderia multivorans]MEB2520244.1 hypothetical protein [Burkholderia multivorans]MEB2572245.1 hypothetical protein [Burkholderia multivorans]MEB2594314.1 hypothetical protein [Burkholderia multivorans]